MLKRADFQDRLAFDTRSLDELKSSAKQNSPESIKEAAKQFEALFMGMMLKSMRQAGGQEGLMDNEQTRMYTQMLDQQFSQKIANRGVGLADMLVKQLSRQMGEQIADTVSPDNTLAGADKLVKSSSSRGINAYLDGLKFEQNSVPANNAASNPAKHVRDFQQKLAEHAEIASKETGIPAKFMLGQAALESGWGKREIKAADGSASHNLFGLKAGKNWKGRTVDAVTTEYVNGVAQKRVEKFRAYDSYADAFKDYAKLLSSNPRYENVVANAKDAASFAQGLQKAGYATDPLYADKLTKLIKSSFPT